MTKRARSRFALYGLIVYGAVVLFATLMPKPAGDGFESRILNLLDALYRRGVPSWFDFHVFEFTANIIMFVPLGIFIGLLLPRGRQWVGIFILPLLSFAIETAQFVFLATRLATVSDLIANSLGGWIGLALTAFIRVVFAPRNRRDMLRE